MNLQSYCVDALAHLAPERDLVVVVDHRVVGQDAAADGTGTKEEMMAPTPPRANLVSQLMRATLPEPS